MRDAASGAGRRRVSIGVAAGVLLLGAWWIWHEPSVSPPGQAGAKGAASNSGAPEIGAAGGVGSPGSHAAASAKAPPSPASSAAADQAREALAGYLVFSELPPWSRIADGSQKHLWDWNATTPIGQAFARDKKGRPLSASLSLDRMFAAPGEAITATLTVWTGEFDTKTPQPVDLKVAGWIEAWRKPGDAGGAEGFAPVQQVTFTSRPGGPGHRYTATFTPSSVAALKPQAEARFVARIDPGDGDPSDRDFSFAQPFRYAAEEPLVILDRHSDQNVDGSLQVTVAVDVKAVGPVMVQATVFDATGTQPIAVYDSFYRPARTGLQEITITFFGRALRQRGIDGPYTVKALHGFVRLPDADPPEVFWKSDATISTRSYAVGDFSDAEWDSPEKQAKIDQYKRLIDGFEHNGL